MRLSTENLVGLLKAALVTVPKFDVAAYQQCVSDRSAKARVDDDVAFALRNGIRSTPTLFINDRKVEGAIRPEQLRTIIKEEMHR